MLLVESSRVSGGLIIRKCDHLTPWVSSLLTSLKTSQPSECDECWRFWSITLHILVHTFFREIITMPV